MRKFCFEIKCQIAYVWASSWQSYCRSNSLWSRIVYIIVPSPITPPFRRASVSLTTVTINAVNHLLVAHLLHAYTIHPGCHVSKLPLSRRMLVPTKCLVIILLKRERERHTIFLVILTIRYLTVQCNLILSFVELYSVEI